MSLWERTGCALTDIGTFWTNHSERGQSRFLSQSVMAKSGNRTAHSHSPSHIMTHYAKTTNSLGAYSNRTYRTQNSISNILINVLFFHSKVFREISSKTHLNFEKFCYFSIFEKAFDIAKTILFDIIFFETFKLLIANKFRIEISQKSAENFEPRHSLED